MRLPLHTLALCDESKGGHNTANYSLNVLPSLTRRRMNARTALFSGDSPRVPSVQLEIMGMILSQTGSQPAAGATLRPPQPDAGATLRRPQPDAGATLRRPQPDAGATLRPPQPDAGATLRPPQPDAGATLRCPQPDARATLRPPQPDAGATLRPPQPDAGATLRPPQPDAGATLRLPPQAPPPSTIILRDTGGSSAGSCSKWPRGAQAELPPQCRGPKTVTPESPLPPAHADLLPGRSEESQTPSGILDFKS
uniref:Uncharacterized protein n=1 Tax=Paramormyrops kingsleyae TaxID=1676925 RepID=A0A3B3T1W9_9TELE